MLRQLRRNGDNCNVEPDLTVAFPVGDVGLFYHLDKTTVLQEARAFNDSPINARKCRLLLTKIIYLLYLGEPFNVKEATDLFFNVTKLFQSKDVS